MHRLPVCFQCERPIEYDPIYAAPFCDHDECGSAVFHGICLMEWRERRDTVRQQATDSMVAFMRHLRGECSCSPE